MRNQQQGRVIVVSDAQEFDQVLDHSTLYGCLSSVQKPFSTCYIRNHSRRATLFRPPASYIPPACTLLKREEHDFVCILPLGGLLHPEDGTWNAITPGYGLG